MRFQQLEEEMTLANEEYILAVGRASKFLPCCCLLQTQRRRCLPENLHSQVAQVLQAMLVDNEADLLQDGPFIPSGIPTTPPKS